MLGGKKNWGINMPRLADVLNEPVGNLFVGPTFLRPINYIAREARTRGMDINITNFPVTQDDPVEVQKTGFSKLLITGDPTHASRFMHAIRFAGEELESVAERGFFSDLPALSLEAVECTLRAEVYRISLVRYLGF